MSHSKEEKAIWSEEEQRALIDYLHENRSKADNGNFNMTIYAAAADAIAPFRKSGPEKTAKMCKSKWAKTKAIYSHIQKYQATFETNWDNLNGACISAADESVWEAYVKEPCNSAMKPFRNKGWEHYDKVEAIILNGVASADASTASMSEEGSLSEKALKSNLSVTTSSSPSCFASSAASQTGQIFPMVQNIFMNNILGAINRLNDSLAMPDASSEDRARAMALVLQRDDGLTFEEKTRTMALMSDSPGAVSLYLATDDAVFRNAALRDLIRLKCF